MDDRLEKRFRELDRLAVPSSNLGDVRRRTKAHKGRRILSFSAIAAAGIAAAVIGGSLLLPLGSGQEGLPFPATTGPPDTVQGPVAGPVRALTATPDALWMVTCDERCGNDGRASVGRIVRVDAASGEIIASDPLDSPSDVAVGEGGVWALSFWRGYLYHLDPTTLSLVAKVELELPTPFIPGDKQFLPSNVATGEGAVWVSSGRGAIAQIDPISDEIVRVIESNPPRGIQDMEVGAEAVWLANGGSGIARMDPSSGEVVTRVSIRERDGQLSVADIVLGGGFVWVTGTWAESRQDGIEAYVLTEKQAVYKIDPETNAAVLIDVPTDHGQIAFGEGDLWITSRAEAEIARIEATTGDVIRTYPLEREERLLGVGGGSLWIATADGEIRQIEDV